MKAHWQRVERAKRRVLVTTHIEAYTSRSMTMAWCRMDNAAKMDKTKPVEEQLLHPYEIHDITCKSCLTMHYRFISKHSWRDAKWNAGR